MKRNEFPHGTWEGMTVLKTNNKVWLPLWIAVAVLAAPVWAQDDAIEGAVDEAVVEENGAETLDDQEQEVVE